MAQQAWLADVMSAAMMAKDPAAPAWGDAVAACIAQQHHAGESIATHKAIMPQNQDRRVIMVLLDRLNQPARDAGAGGTGQLYPSGVDGRTIGLAGGLFPQGQPGDGLPHHGRLFQASKAGTWPNAHEDAIALASFRGAGGYFH